VATQAYEELNEWIDPELGVEFADTVARVWREHRARYTTEDLPKDILFMGLDALANVVIGPIGDDE